MKNLTKTLLIVSLSSMNLVFGNCLNVEKVKEEIISYTFDPVNIKAGKMSNFKYGLSFKGALKSAVLSFDVENQEGEATEVHKFNIAKDCSLELIDRNLLNPLTI